MRRKLEEKINKEIAYKQTMKQKESSRDSGDDLDSDEDLSKLVPMEIERRIGRWRRFIYKFRVPNIFEMMTLVFLFLYWTNLFLKIIFQMMFRHLAVVEGKFFDFLALETFQYSILFIDYVIAFTLSAVLV